MLNWDFAAMVLMACTVTLCCAACTDIDIDCEYIWES